MKTYQPKAKEIKRNWHLIDAEGKVLGRIATEIAGLLIGKNKPVFSNHMDMGDFVVVINVDKLVVTGKKAKQKTYKSHSGYPGGFKEVKFEKLMNEQPQKILEHAVRGMLPDNRLKSGRMARLKLFVGSKHPYQDKFRVSAKSDNKIAIPRTGRNTKRTQK